MKEMMTKRLVMTAFAGLMTLAAMAQQQMELTAAEVAQRMAPGWNLGNTMEAQNWATGAALWDNKGGLNAETSWQNTRTTQQIIDYVRAQGFRSVRIPCAWALGHISNASTYTIDAQWMARVKEIVNYCINDGLYVVINDHWDGGWLEEHIKDTGTAKTKNKEILTRLWTQIAEAFKDYDERLLFAGLNEPNADNQAATNNLIEYEQAFIDAVRATGGNNAQRVLIVQGPSTNIDHTCNYMAGKMPTDPAGRLMIEVHYYDPWQFWGMTSDESWVKMFFYWGSANHVSGSTHNATWGEEDYMETQLQKMKARFADNGYPVYIGEFGAIWRTVVGANESQAKHNASIKHHYKTLMAKAFAKGFVPVVWDTNSTGTNQMTIINRSNLTIYNSYMLDGIHEAMEEAGIDVTGIDPVLNTPFPALNAKSSAIYDLQGRRVSEPLRPGIYIRGGKKYVVK